MGIIAQMPRLTTVTAAATNVGALGRAPGGHVVVVHVAPISIIPDSVPVVVATHASAFGLAVDGIGAS